MNLLLKLPRIIQIIDSQGDQFVYKLLDVSIHLLRYNIGATNLVKISSDDDLFLNTRLIKLFFVIYYKYLYLIYVYNGPQIQLLIYTNSWL